MTFTHRISMVAATLSLTAAGLVGPLSSVTSASPDAATTPDASLNAAGELYGPYSSEGTCNYWRYAMEAAGYRTEPCYRFPAVQELWFFRTV